MEGRERRREEEREKGRKEGRKVGWIHDGQIDGFIYVTNGSLRPKCDETFIYTRAIKLHPKEEF